MRKLFTIAVLATVLTACAACGGSRAPYTAPNGVPTNPSAEAVGGAGGE